MAESAAVLNKECLEKTVMEVRKFWTSMKQTEYSYRWQIINFKLNENIDNSIGCRKLNWTFKLTKKNRCYTVTISTCNYNEEITCFICYNLNSLSKPFNAHKIREGVHLVNFPDIVVNVQENFFLRLDLIVLLFKFNRKYETAVSTLQRKELDNYILDSSDQILSSTQNPQNTDFTIKIQNDLLYAHKAVLASRSSYFRQYIRENCKDGERGEIELDVEYEAAYGVMDFMYTGRVFFSTTNELLQILELAESLGISSLQTLARKYMEDYVNVKYKNKFRVNREYEP